MTCMDHVIKINWNELSNISDIQIQIVRLKMLLITKKINSVKKWKRPKKALLLEISAFAKWPK